MTSTIKIKGMSCQHCVMAVTKALKEIEGLSSVNVDLQDGSATIEHSGPIDMNRVKSVVEREGYQIG
jgi:copper chaperone